MTTAALREKSNTGDSHGLILSLMVMVGMSSAISGAATPVTWTNTFAYADELSSRASTQWGNVTNWVDAGGAMPTVAPTNGVDQFAVTLAPHAYVYDAEGKKVLDEGYRKLITTGSWSGSDSNIRLDYPAVDPAIASIEGPASYRITHTVMSTYKQQKARVFTVGDPNNFLGWWATGDAYAWFRLLATETFTPTLQGLYTSRRPYVDVPAAGTTAAVAALGEGGSLDKVGPGTLQVGPSADPSSGFLVEEGTLELRGRDEGELARILNLAALHLDADNESTLVYTNVVEEPGYRFVDRWNDVRGNGNYAYFPDFRYGNPASEYAVYYYPYTLPPFESPATSPTGRRLIDFGSKFADKGALGPSNCVLKLNKAVTGISDAFVVEWDPKGGTDVTLLGGLGGATLDYNRKGLYLWGPSQHQLNNGFKTCEVIFNDGVYWWNDPVLKCASLTNLFTACFSSEATGRVEALGTDRYYLSRSNRTRAGEIILFTNSLTRAERLIVSRYLEAKWRTGLPHDLDGYSAVTAAGAKIAVDEGHTAYLATVTATNGTFVKAGAGTLAVEQLSPAGVAVVQEAGTVKFTQKLRAPTSTGPAADAYIWLDASDAADFTFEDGSDTRVTVWRDHRADKTVVATACDDQKLGNLPTLQRAAVNGKAVVSMGRSAASQQAYFALPTWTDAAKYVYAGFMVLRPSVAGSTSHNYFGSSDLTMMRNSGYGILSATYKQADALAARWTINGDVVDPMARQSAYTRQTNDFFVLSFLSSQPLVMNAINKDRRGQQAAGCGDIEVGEVLVYHRKLDIEEFRDTEAYLMKKWLGKEHPAVGAAHISSLMAADGQDAVLDADRDIVVDEVVATGEKFVKKGTGSADVRQMPVDTPPMALAVEGGALKPKFAFNPDNSALFHFDASNVDSMRLQVSDDQAVTNVTHWYDSRGNGLYARSEWDAQTTYAKDRSETSFAFAVTDPKLVTVTLAEGVTGLALDFGTKRNCQDKPTAAATSTTAAAMRFYDANVKRTNGDDSETRYDTVQETFLVVARHGSQGNNLIGDASAAGTTTDAAGRLLPNGGNYMSVSTLAYPSYSYLTLTNDSGTVFVNGESVKGSTYTFTEAMGFKLIEYRPGGNTRVGALALDRNCNAGGCYICEVIGFDHVLTDAERTQLRAQLQNKWFGLELPPRTFTSIEVVPGASLDMGTADLAVSSVSGGGLLTCGGLTLAGFEAAAEIAVAYHSAEDVDCFTVTSPVSFPNGVKVSVSFAGVNMADVVPGEWPIFTAPGLTLAPHALSFEHDYAGTRCVSIVRSGNTLLLRVMPRGTTIIFR
ncbi:MAG: hypothetical protein MJ240_00265 [Kiritimatiellae bacterium]|nr:hypothetical protein [Kiritimatiellia bacterium]